MILRYIPEYIHLVGKSASNLSRDIVEYIYVRCKSVHSYFRGTLGHIHHFHSRNSVYRSLCRIPEHMFVH